MVKGIKNIFRRHWLLYWLCGIAVLIASFTGVWLANREKAPMAAVNIPDPPVLVAPIPKKDSIATASKAKLAPTNTSIAKSEKKKKRKISSKVLIPAIPDTLPYIEFNAAMLQALFEQANYLYRKDVPERGASGITKTEMLQTVERLQGMQLLDPSALLTSFDFYRVNTDIKSDRVRMTGYYTPLIKASRTQTAEHPIPMLRRPESDVPSPAAIEAGALNGRGLDLAWISSKKELSNAQLQGSCLIEFPDGKRQHLGFGGSKKGDGGTYVFFTKVDEQVLGCGFFPLTAGYSVAVDLKYIPIGATLLAELPDLDAAGRQKGYKYRIIFAQDRGGAIQTTKRMDLYCGVGHKGLLEARKINRFGRLWVLLPK